MMTKNLKKTLLIVAMLVFSLSLSLFAFTASPVKADTGFAGGLTMTMEKGAFLRVSAEANQNDSGLRFRATLENYDENDTKLTYGVVIIPADYITTYKIPENEYIQKLDELVQAGTISTYIKGLAKPVQIDGKWVVQHSIAPIKEGNFNREFFGVAYVTDGTNYMYAKSNDNVRSVTYISSVALNELKYNENLEEGTKNLYQANEDVLKNFVQKGVKNVTEELTYQITGNNVTNQPNGTIDLSLNITDGVNIQSKWFSSDTKVAEVDGDGVVTMKQYGAATITVRSADLYSSSVEVYAAEEGVVAPFNTCSATNFIYTAGTAYTESVNSDANYTYGDEAYSLKLSRTADYNGGAAFYFKNCIISDLNAKDAEGNYLYNYMTFSIYVDHHGSSNVEFRVGGNSYKTVATNTWLTYFITRDGKSENFVGGIFDNEVLVSDLNTFFIAVWQNAGKAIDVYISAVRVGAVDVEPNVAVPFNKQSDVKFVTLEDGGRYTISSGLPVDGKGQPIKYNGEETALKLVPASDYTGTKEILLKASFIDLTVKEGENYKYNTITFGVYIESKELDKEDLGAFSWWWPKVETNKWVTLNFNRVGQTNDFTCDNSAFTGSKEITSLINKNLGIKIDNAGDSDAFYVSAIRVS